LGQKTLQLGPSLPPVTAAATTCRTGRNRQSYFGGEEWEVVNSLVFVATGSRRHRRRPQLPLLLVRATAAAAAAWGRGFGHLVLARVWVGVVWTLCFWAAPADFVPDALDFGPNK